MESIAIDITDFTNKSELFTQDLLKRGIDLTKPFKIIATTVMVPSFQQNFMEQGRPEKWKGLKPETIIARYYRRNKGKGLVSKKKKKKKKQKRQKKKKKKKKKKPPPPPSYLKKKKKRRKKNHRNNSGLFD